VLLIHGELNHSREHARGQAKYCSGDVVSMATLHDILIDGEVLFEKANLVSHVRKQASDSRSKVDHYPAYNVTQTGTQQQTLA